MKQKTKKIMILMAERTGTGHKSAANAIEKKLDDKEYEVKQLDCFNLMGKFGTILENSYIPITTKNPLLFYFAYLLTQIFPNVMHNLIYISSKKRLKQEIEEFNPDLIISVHSMFTKAISKFLKKQKLKIPYYINVIDLVKPPKVWFDKNATTIFVPTKEVKEEYIQKGINEDKLIISGFPIREDIKKRNSPKKVEDNINILLVNPSVKLRKSIKYVKETSKIENSCITVVCGRDEKLYKSLIKLQKQGKILPYVQIYGFVKNIHELLEKSHILLTKAGPNMLLEGARSATAIIVTGHIKGQENKNYEYVTKNGFGLKCENPRKINNIINNFIKSKKLDECLKNVLNADCNNGAEIIVNYINKNLKK